MITYIQGSPKIHAPNATITNPTVITRTVRAGETFEYTHTSSLRAAIELSIVAPNTTSLQVQILSTLTEVTSHTSIVQSWTETIVNFKLVSGQTLKLDPSSDMYIRLIILGESS